MSELAQLALENWRLQNDVVELKRLLTEANDARIRAELASSATVPTCKELRERNDALKRAAEAESKLAAAEKRIAAVESAPMFWTNSAWFVPYVSGGVFGKIWSQRKGTTPTRLVQLPEGW